MPPLPTPEIPQNVPDIAKATEVAVNTYSGEIYAIMLFFFIGLIVIFVILLLIIKIWGNPINVAKSASLSGKAIIQHLENSRIGSLKLASIGGGALRHQNIEDGTLIAIPKGINNLEGSPFVNSWNLTGITVPTFLIGAITKLREYGYLTRQKLQDAIDQNKALRATLLSELQIAITSKDEKNQKDLESKLQETPDIENVNLITESYDFNNFSDIIKKSKSPTLYPLQIEHTNEFIQPINQHYTEADITKEIKSYMMGIPDTFGRTFLLTGIGIFIVALAIYFMMGSIK